MNAEQNVEEQVLSRFKAEFEDKLADVKFFVRRTRASVTDLFRDVDLFEKAIEAKDVEEVGSIDSHSPKIRFDAPFSGR